MVLKNIFTIILIHFSLLSFSQSDTRELISSSGEVFLNQNYQLSWSIGEPIIDAYTNTEGTLTNGLHQGQLVVTKTYKVPETNISVYPVPTCSNINIEIEETLERFSYKLSDINGKLIKDGLINNEFYSVDLSTFLSGNYYLSIYNSESTLLMTYKIIKQ